MLAIFGERLLQSRNQQPPDTPSVLAAIARGARAYQPVGVEARARRTAQLVSASAWTEAALALAESELLAWHLSRLELDSGEWVCTLSRHPRLPEELDEVIYGRDRLLPLAILDALVEAQRRSATPPAEATTSDVRSITAWSDDVFR